jgi:hypothetical protein
MRSTLSKNIEKGNRRSDARRTSPVWKGNQSGFARMTAMTRSPSIENSFAKPDPCMFVPIARANQLRTSTRMKAGWHRRGSGSLAQVFFDHRPVDHRIRIAQSLNAATFQLLGLNLGQRRRLGRCFDAVPERRDQVELFLDRKAGEISWIDTPEMVPCRSEEVIPLQIARCMEW